MGIRWTLPRLGGLHGRYCGDWEVNGHQVDSATSRRTSRHVHDVRPSARVHVGDVVRAADLHPQQLSLSAEMNTVLPLGASEPHNDTRAEVCSINGIHEGAFISKPLGKVDRS